MMGLKKNLVNQKNKLFKSFSNLPKNPINLVKHLFTKFKKHKNKITAKRAFVVVITFIAFAALAQNYYLLRIQNNSISKNDSNNSKPQNTKQTGKLTKGIPEFTTLIPAGKTINDLGGWTRVSPSSADPVFAYIDKISNIPINLSQQPLPDNFKTDTEDQIASLASDFKATEKITVGSTIVYIGTSAKGPQSAIFSKNDLLILIKSSVQISNDSWANYINSLQ